MKAAIKSAARWLDHVILENLGTSVRISIETEDSEALFKQCIEILRSRQTADYQKNPKPQSPDCGHSSFVAAVARLRTVFRSLGTAATPTSLVSYRSATPLGLEGVRFHAAKHGKNAIS